ncbi:MAG: thiamine pyrophosphate-binding protein [Rhodocyclaceae bacterium]|nr:thiamine pyrophosphate-binding protein [Rhodocyclaceae bacterium]
MKIAVSEVIVRFMERLGIAHAFGMPGAHILPIYDRLYDSKIQSILVKHEQGAAFMACGYARAGNRIAACITSAGPGATNLVTGIANAYVEKLPVLVITGETSTYIFGKGGLQEGSGEGGTIDQAALFEGITRYRKVIERTDYLAQVLKQAAKILLAADSGPVLLSIPYNVQKELVGADILDDIGFDTTTRAPHMAAAAAGELAQMIAAASRPVIVAGYGCFKSGAEEALAQLSEHMGVPVATSLKGKGLVDERSGLSLGCLGITSDGIAFRYVVDHADLVIFLGAGFNERTSHLWDARLLAGKKVVQVDNDAAQLEKVFKADLAIHGDIGDVLGEVLATLNRTGAARKAGDALAALRSAGGAAMAERFPLIEHFYARLAARFSRDGLFFDDNIVFAQSFFKASPGNRYFPNSGVSSLGHAVPAAIGARFACDAPTFAILGDGGFQMCCMELMTAVNYGVPLNAVVFNNATMGLIRKNQFQLYRERFIDCDFINPDYGYLAKSFGISHRKIETLADVDALFAGTDFAGAINLIEIMLDKNAFPSYLSDR